MDSRFIRDTTELEDAVWRFMEVPELWRDAIGGHPKYFVHCKRGKEDGFGLSKFCVFRRATLARYVAVSRRETDGGIAQRHIRRVVGAPWVPLCRVSRPLRLRFENWFSGFAPDSYDRSKISLLSLPAFKGRLRRSKRPRRISPEELARRLRQQERTGRIGERLAMEFEWRRLKDAGVSDPRRWVEQVSLLDAAAGYDIRTSAPTQPVRYIEVKSTTNGAPTCFITINQLGTLRDLRRDAWIYVVNTKNGDVWPIQNPVANVPRKQLEPILFQYRPVLPRRL
jgi:hypothetical protein